VSVFYDFDLPDGTRAARREDGGGDGGASHVSSHENKDVFMYVHICIYMYMYVCIYIYLYILMLH